ncbi:hypothetical protein M427DRAFT_50241 [Gonapodya prolifera JEL478]|uniref:Helicase C-terminal domain-containing protein n=1 Tax=Gonapodya prolifera (strain JEL478) TaxID=1344416 RepID=A0A138ZX73_GONPJ|nr:hypothetical protein M427DRAFT_50241 [Gonapodya prolifera JEL478]|eukprot:KXS08875.1 hypothetical protein M427DRAFT_50241 [Gonapodya prolifera JEL478]
MNRATNITATTLAQYFGFSSCNVFLRKQAYVSRDGGTVVDNTKFLTKRLFEKGVDFESKLNQSLKNIPEVYVSDLSNHLDPITGILESIHEARNYGKQIIYAINVTFPRFSHTGVTYGLSKPDFIRFDIKEDNLVEWKVIDAKASKNQKLYHKVQRLLVMLSKKLEPESIFHESFRKYDIDFLKNAEVTIDGIRLIPSELGGVWLPGNICKDEPFKLKYILPTVRDFVESTISNILALPEKDIERNASIDCSFCPHREECHKDALERKSIEAIGGLHSDQIISLRNALPKQQTNGITDIEDLENMIRQDDIQPALKDILNIDKETKLSSKIEAVKKREAVISKTVVTDLPSSEKIAIYVSVMIDLYNSSMICYILQFGMRQEIKTENVDIKNLLGRLGKIVKASVGKTLSIFIPTTAEYTYLKDHIVKLKPGDIDDNIRALISAWMRVDPDGSIMHVQDIPSDNDPIDPDGKWRYENNPTTSDFHVTVIDSVLNRNFDFPGPGILSLSNKMKYFLELTEDEEKAFDDDCLIEQILHGRDVAKECKIAYESRAFKPRPLETLIQTESLRSYIYGALLESHLNSKKFQNKRLSGENIIKVQLPNYKGFAHKNIPEEHVCEIVSGKDIIDNEILKFGTLENIGFSWIMTTTKVAQTGFADDKYSKELAAPSGWTRDVMSKDIVFCCIREVLGEDTKIILTISKGCHLVFKGWLKRGSIDVYISYRNIDYTMFSSIKTAVELDQNIGSTEQNENMALNGMSDDYDDDDDDIGPPPTSVMFDIDDEDGGFELSIPLNIKQQNFGSVNLNHKLWLEIFENSQILGARINGDFRTLNQQNIPVHPPMFDSQERAFQHIMEHQLSVIWGPPGSGKTFFLALACLRLIEMRYRSKKRGFRIAMTAFTKSAIGQFCDRFNILREQAIANGWLTAPVMPVHLITNGNRQPPPLLNENTYGVWAATVWQYSKWYQKRVANCLSAFDMLVIDEGSQLNPFTTLPAFRVVAYKARIVVVGDPLQLPPISSVSISKEYMKEHGKGPFGTSLIDLLTSGGYDHVKQLRENFRMSKQICEFISRGYPEKFISMAKQVNERKVHPSQSKLVRNIQESKRDLFTCTISDPDNESLLVSILAIQLRANYASVFIATPYLIQSNSIKKHLRAQDEEYEQFIRVDTPERLQGAETDDMQRPNDREMGFIFSKPKLNVAVSRAKHICILVTTSEVTKPSGKFDMSVTSAEIDDGVNFIKDYVSSSVIMSVELDDLKMMGEMDASLDDSDINLSHNVGKEGKITQLQQFQAVVVKYVMENLQQMHGLILYHGIGSGKTITQLAIFHCLHQQFPMLNYYFVVPKSLVENVNINIKKLDLDFSFVTIYTHKTFANKVHREGLGFCKDAVIAIDESHNFRTKIRMIKTPKRSTPNTEMQSGAGPDQKRKRNDQSSESVEIDYNELLSDETKDDEDDMLDRKISVGSLLFNSTEDLVNQYVMVTGGTPATAHKLYGVFGRSPAHFTRWSSNIENQQLKKIGNKPQSLVFQSSLRRALNSVFTTIEDEPKMEWIVVYIRDHIFGQVPKRKIVIYSAFLGQGIVDVLNLLKNSGATPRDRRAEIVANYNKDEIDVLFISNAGSEGLHLECTHAIILLEPQWNLEIMHQVVGRVVRYKSHANCKPGIEKQVEVYKLRASKPETAYGLSADDRLKELAFAKHDIDVKFVKIALDIASIENGNRPSDRKKFKGE